MRPLLAATATEADLANLTYPLIASPKLDGIRCLIHPELGPVSRKLKPIPNNFIREYLSQSELVGLDGEIMTDNEFNNLVSDVMSTNGTPDFTYWVFDDFTSSGYYIDRVNGLLKRKMPIRICVLESALVSNVNEALQHEHEYLARGFEGIMLRSPKGAYKHGRSTLNEQILIKFKRFVDADGVITGIEELFRNGNPQERDELGYSKRTSHAVNLAPAGILGSLVVKSSIFEHEFKVGTGFDEQQRKALWDMRATLIGKEVAFKYQPTGVKDKPRFPSFISLRED